MQRYINIINEYINVYSYHIYVYAYILCLFCHIHYSFPHILHHVHTFIYLYMNTYMASIYKWYTHKHVSIHCALRLTYCVCLAIVAIVSSIFFLMYIHTFICLHMHTFMGAIYKEFIWVYICIYIRVLRLTYCVCLAIVAIVSSIFFLMYIHTFICLHMHTFMGAIYKEFIWVYICIYIRVLRLTYCVCLAIVAIVSSIFFILASICSTAPTSTFKIDSIDGGTDSPLYISRYVYINKCRSVIKYVLVLDLLYIFKIDKFWC
jgi:hypothetical protein